MNRALLYLWWTLLRRRCSCSCRGLRRPTTLIACLWVLGIDGCLFYYRGNEAFGRMIRREVLVGAILIMILGSVIKGFLQRGLAFEPADIEFVFTSPFTQRQILLYRLLPQYLYAAIQGIVFAAWFAPHLRHPVLAAGCVTLFQVACFHLAMAAAVWGGAVSDRLHYRLRWMMLGTCFVLTALYFRVAWEVDFVPACLRSPLVQLAFYPAMTPSDVTTSAWLRGWLAGLARTGDVLAPTFLDPALCLAGFGLAAALSLWGLLRLKASVFEPALGTTTRRAEARLRAVEGRAGVAAVAHARSARLPRFPLFQGVGALVWRNLMAVRRSRKDLLAAFAFVGIYSTILIALLWKFHQYVARAPVTLGSDAPEVSLSFHLGVAIFIAALAFFLQRLFPFDFRRDGNHVVGFRTLPVSPLALVLAEVSVPTFLVLVSQAVGLVPLLIFGRFPWPLLPPLLLSYPAIALALNSVWNLHYLLTAARQAAGRAEAASPAGTLMVVVFSFLVFFPAIWTAQRLCHFLSGPQALPFAITTGLAIQIGIDVLMILALAGLFQRFEVSRDTRANAL